MIRHALLFCLWVLAALSAMVSGGAWAVRLDLVPSAVIVAPGDLVPVEVRIAGLGAGVAPSVGAFDLNVAFDPLLFATPAVLFGSELGKIPTEAIDIVDHPAAGIVNIAEVSLLSPEALHAAQPDDFTLATLFFSALGAGSASFHFDGFTRVDDAYGRKLLPEPAVPALLAVSLCALFSARRRPTRTT